MTTNAMDHEMVESTRALKLRTANLEGGLHNIIDGERSLSSGWLTVIDPATGQALAAVPDIDRDDLERAVDAARKAFPAWSKIPYNHRKAMLLGILNEIEQYMEELSARAYYLRGGL